ncbi:cysteine protease, putative [Ricinus communis]|uniref:Cysteine protease, putative n=1 Tax=Ricinus communis TaxID=3988 RepID=B9R776_RICCO|nr:cysteine protease, putative [Ricinus communis]
MERNTVSVSGKCGIAMMAYYPIKKGQNPPNPGPSPPSPVKPPTFCDNYNSCPVASMNLIKYCFAWGCCPLEDATCCDDHTSCCPHDYPVNTVEGTCLISKDNPFGVRAMRRIPLSHIGHMSLKARRAVLKQKGRSLR